MIFWSFDNLEGRRQSAPVSWSAEAEQATNRAESEFEINQEEDMKKDVIVKAGTKTWFLDGETPVAEFIQATPVTVEGPIAFGWYKTVGPVPGFLADKVVCLKAEDFDYNE